jgi:hypothetical protein
MVVPPSSAARSVTSTSPALVEPGSDPCSDDNDGAPVSTALSVPNLTSGVLPACMRSMAGGEYAHVSRSRL